MNRKKLIMMIMIIKMNKNKINIKFMNNFLIKKISQIQCRLLKNKKLKIQAFLQFYKTLMS